MKTLKPLLLVLALLATTGTRSLALVAIDLSNFGNSVESVDWNWNTATSNLTGTDAPGAVLYPSSFAPVNFTLLNNYNDNPSNVRLNLTGLVTTAPPGGFSISLEDGNGVVRATTITWSSFTPSSATVTVPVNILGPGTFQWNNVVGWTLDAGGTGAPVNATFTQLTATAVPEPSTYALLSLAGLALGGYAARRRLRA